MGYLWCDDLLLLLLVEAGVILSCADGIQRVFWFSPPVLAGVVGCDEVVVVVQALSTFLNSCVPVELLVEVS